MRTTLAPWLLLTLLGCDIPQGGNDAIKPTDKVLASIKKEEPPAPYSDPYADGTRLTTELQKVRGECDKIQVRVSSAVTTGLKITKEDRQVLDAITLSLSGACNRDDLKVYGELAEKSLSIANDFRKRSLDGVDLFKGEVDASKEKQEKLWTALADAYEGAGNLGLNLLQTHLMYAPLPQRKEVAAFFFDLNDRLPPDHSENTQKKRFGEAMIAEGDEELRKLLRAEVYGTLPE